VSLCNIALIKQEGFIAFQGRVLDYPQIGVSIPNSLKSLVPFVVLYG